MEWRALVQWRAPGNHRFLRLPSLGDKPSFCGLSPYIYRLSTLPWTSAALCSHLLCYFAPCYIFSSKDTLPQLSSSNSCGRHWQVHIFYTTSYGYWSLNPLLRHVSHSSSIYSCSWSKPPCTLHYNNLRLCLLDKNILPQQWILSNHKWFYLMMRNFLSNECIGCGRGNLPGQPWRPGHRIDYCGHHGRGTIDILGEPKSWGTKKRLIFCYLFAFCGTGGQNWFLRLSPEFHWHKYFMFYICTLLYFSALRQLHGQPRHVSRGSNLPFLRLQLTTSLPARSLVHTRVKLVSKQNDSDFFCEFIFTEPFSNKTFIRTIAKWKPACQRGPSFTLAWNLCQNRRRTVFSS